MSGPQVSAGRMLRAARRAERDQWLVPAALAARTRRRLAALLRWSYDRVPFHRERMRRAAIDPRRSDAADRFSELPPMTRDDLDQGAANGLLPAGLATRVVQSSGSSGRVLSFHQSPAYGALVAFPLWRRAYAAGGLLPQHRLLRITHPGRFEYPTLGRTRDLQVSAPVDFLIRSLREYRPHALVSQASCIEFLAEEFLARRLAPPAELALLFTLGDTLTAAARRRIEEAFGSSPMDHYAAKECAGGIAWQCRERQGYHLNADTLVLEIVDDLGRPVGPGAPGEVLVTDLASAPVPILRYRLGDVAAGLDGSCACGRGLPRLHAIHGRTSERMRLAGGEWLTSHKLAGMMDRIPGVRHFAARQTAPERLLLEVAPRPGACAARVRAAIEEGLARMALGAVQVEIRLVPPGAPPPPLTKRRIITPLEPPAAAGSGAP